MSKTLDLVIIGGGCAGLSLATELAKTGYSGRLLIIEARKTYAHDRTWCFWAPRKHTLADIVSKTWDSWTLSNAATSITQVGDTRIYQQIRSIDFYIQKLKELAAFSNIELQLNSPVTDILECGSRAKIITDSDSYVANQIIDTRPPSLTAQSAPVWQIFSGGEVVVDRPVFDVETAGLMTSLEAGRVGLKFVYVLPQTPNTALVQTTYFSRSLFPAKRLDDVFAQDLHEVAGPNAQIKRWERGVLPMGLHPPERKDSAYTLSAGMAAGALRASSGYAFSRIQLWARQTAKHLCRGLPLEPARHGDALEAMMDKIFLKAFARNPEYAPS
ncbi:MAG: lycopene cyclase family protein, partial [Pseudomonadota bacterium]